jgi:hypothetical protein
VPVVTCISAAIHATHNSPSRIWPIIGIRVSRISESMPYSTRLSFPILALIIMASAKLSLQAPSGMMRLVSLRKR